MFDLMLILFWDSIFVPFTNYNIDLYNHGDPTPGTPITLWWTWEGLHQTWKIERRTCPLSVPFPRALTRDLFDSLNTACHASCRIIPNVSFHVSTCGLYPHPELFFFNCTPLPTYNFCIHDLAAAYVVVFFIVSNIPVFV